MTAIVKVIQNPKAENCFHIRYASDSKLNIKIIVCKPDELVLTANNLRHFLKGTIMNYKVQFNWKSAPAAARTNEEFKKIIFQTFESIPSVKKSAEKIITPDKTRLYAEHIKKYVESYGNAPDFANITPKGKTKVHNFMKNALGMPHLTLYEVEQILPYLESL